MGNYGSHNFSANTDYQLIYTKRILYNIPIGENISSLKWICAYQDLIMNNEII